MANELKLSAGWFARDAEKAASRVAVWERANQGSEPRRSSQTSSSSGSRDSQHKEPDNSK